MRRAAGFTLIELAIAMTILLMVMLVAVPSLAGVLADRRLRRSLDEMNRFAHDAQQRSVAERRPYLIVWDKTGLELRPESFAKGEKPGPSATLAARSGEAFELTLPAALEKEPPSAWAFWPSGTCEPAIVSFRGPDGNWRAKYSPLTSHAEIASYATR